MDLFDLTGRTAVVTGGTRGIGLMIARGLLQAGADRVYISSREAEGCAGAERERGEYGAVTGIPADLSTEAECLRLAKLVGNPRVSLARARQQRRSHLGLSAGRVPGSSMGQGH